MRCFLRLSYVPVCFHTTVVSASSNFRRALSAQLAAVLDSVSVRIESLHDGQQFERPPRSWLYNFHEPDQRPETAVAMVTCSRTRPNDPVGHNGSVTPTSGSFPKQLIILPWSYIYRFYHNNLFTKLPAHSPNRQCLLLQVDEHSDKVTARGTCDVYWLFVHLFVKEIPLYFKSALWYTALILRP